MGLNGEAFDGERVGVDWQARNLGQLFGGVGWMVGSGGMKGDFCVLSQPLMGHDSAHAGGASRVENRRLGSAFENR